MGDDADQDLSRAVGVTSVQAWRGTFGGEPEPDGTPFTFDAVVIEFGVDVGAIPPLFVPVEAVPGLAEVLLEAANGPNAPVGGDNEEHGAGSAAAPPGDGSREGDLASPGAVEVGGEEWAVLLAQPRHDPSMLDRSSLPSHPGVYAWFRSGSPVHVGRATGKHGLRARIGGDLLHDTDLSRSPFRRAVAEHLAVPLQAADGQVWVGAEAASAVDGWIGGCTVTWLACATPEVALDLEAALLAEHRPSLLPGAPGT